MTVEEVYEKYQHLDLAVDYFCGPSTASRTFFDLMLFELWQAVKEEAVKTKVQEAHHENDMA